MVCEESQDNYRGIMYRMLLGFVLFLYRKLIGFHTFQEDIDVPPVYPMG